MRGSRQLTMFLALVALALTPLASTAQPATGEASLSITVQDNYGVIPGAVVRLTRPDGSSLRQVADDSGVASFSGLAAGTYAVKVSFSGFADYEQADVAIGSGEQQAIDATLSLRRFSESVTVTTANRREQLLLDVAEPTTLIDQDQIEDTGGRTAKDVLIEQSGAGVQVQAGGGQGHVSINGIGNSGVLVLINGRRYLGRDGIGNFNIEDINLSSVERVEIVKGAGSALYGTDAQGGVINFISRKATDRGVTNSAELTAGSYTDVSIKDNFGYRGERGGLTATGSWRTYDGFDLDPENPQTIGQPESKWYEFETNADYQFSDKVIGRIFGTYSRRNIDNYFFSGATQLPTDVYNSQRELTRYNISPEIDFLFSQNTELKITYDYGKYNRDETQIYPDREVEVPWKEWNQELKATLRQTWRAFEQEHPLQLGYEFRRQEMDRANLILPGTDSTRVDRDINVFWLQQEVNIGSRLTLTGGFRYDDYTDFGNEWSPKGSAVVKLAEGHRLRGSYGHGFRAPRFGELYIDLGFFFKGNPNLQPVVSDTWTAGYAYAGPKVQASIDYYDTKLDNQVVFDFSGFPFSPITYRNIEGESTSKGVNAELAVNLPGGFTPSIAYTFSDRKDSDGEKIGGFPPPHAAIVKLLWANPRLGLRANIRGNLVSEQDPIDDTDTPGYQIWKVQVAKKFAARGPYAFRVYAQVDNLFDEENTLRRDLSGEPIPGELQTWYPPRTFQVGITVDMDWAK